MDCTRRVLAPYRGGGRGHILDIGYIRRGYGFSHSVTGLKAKMGMGLLLPFPMNDQRQWARVVVSCQR